LRYIGHEVWTSAFDHIDWSDLHLCERPHVETGFFATDSATALTASRQWPPWRLRASSSERQIASVPFGRMSGYGPWLCENAASVKSGRTDFRGASFLARLATSIGYDRRL